MLTDKDLKSRGVAALKEELYNNHIANISVFGKTKYVVMDIKTYNEYKSLDLNISHKEVEKDLKNGDFITSLEEHIIEINKVINNANNKQ